MNGPRNLPAVPQFLPHNRQEHDNDMRALIGKHMGGDFSNPTQWVVDAVHEAFQRGFSLGLASGGAARPHPTAEVVQPARKRLTLRKPEIIRRLTVADTKLCAVAGCGGTCVETIYDGGPILTCKKCGMTYE